MGIFGLEFENNIVIFEISTLDFALLETIAEKQKCVNSRPKMVYLAIFGQQF